MLVLTMLRERARYGYDIAKGIEKLSDQRLTFQHGTLYPILHKLEKKGLIVGVWEHPEGERSRRIYALTDKGRSEIETQIADWLEYTAAIDKVIRGSSVELPA